MTKLYKVTCCGKSSYGISTTKNDNIFVVAKDESEASNKAMVRIKELKYNLIDDYVSNVELIADVDDWCGKLLIL